MIKYLKLFDTHADYNTYITGQDKVLPNVSYCENENEVHYNPYTDPKLVCKYNITDTSSATTLRTVYGNDTFKSIEIDGVLLDSLVTSYQFSTTGEHTVKYTLADPTTIGDYAFFDCSGLTSVTIPNTVNTISQYAFLGCSGLTNITIPNSVTSIGESAFESCSGLTSISIPNNVTTISESAFYGCSGLTSVTIPNSVTSIGIYAFIRCSGLTSVTVQATTPPTLGNDSFNNTNDCPIYVPSASVEAYKAATNWSTYASRIQAIS